MSLFTVSVPAKAPLSLTSVHELYNKMEGRDKLGKLVQYGARGVAWWQDGQGKDIKATRVYKGTAPLSRTGRRVGFEARAVAGIRWPAHSCCTRRAHCPRMTGDVGELHLKPSRESALHCLYKLLTTGTRLVDTVAGGWS